ncbi:hypothetical protein N7481_002542 [Penicillium waksmanii]|uniref:uncharacterized protein n=1 Tax=Penicillium waksmanii TaxID=69791 RepID=UPI002549531D|nr:uncharacterized protein N7481_002542 [Penicillium waksmanii]KAJ5995565.1 hypothetical protein N7481_002542 [Penicillium waksmanii]
MSPKKAFNPKRACDICYAKKVRRRLQYFRAIDLFTDYAIPIQTLCLLPTPEGPCERCVYRSLECTFEREKPSKKRRIRYVMPPNLFRVESVYILTFLTFDSRSASSNASSDSQALSQRVRQLENALAITQVESRPELSGCHIASPKEPRKPASLAASSLPSGRSGIVLSARSPYSCLSSSIAINTCNSVAADDSAGVDVSAYQFGPNWFFNGIPIFSEEGIKWLSTRTDQNVNWAEFLIPMTDPSPLSLIESPGEICHLPDQDETRRTLNGLFESPFRLTFPVIDESLFESTMQIAYDPVDKNMASATQLAARACILAALSITASSIESHQRTQNIDAEMCAAKAQIILVNLAETTNLDTLQAIILLVSRIHCSLFSTLSAHAMLKQLQKMFKGRWKGADFFNSISCRIICSLRGHIYTLPKSDCEMTRSEREKTHIRTLFWLCYMLDKDISLRTGSPPLLTETYCDLTAPICTHYSTYFPTSDVSPEPTSPASGLLVFNFPGDTRLGNMKEKVCRQLFSAPALKYNDDQLLLNIRQLDDEIECWRISLPSDVRPALFVSHNSLPHSAEGDIPFIVRRMSLQLEYHHLMTIIHTTVRRCTPSDANESEDLHAVVHSSFDLSLEASRSTILCLRFLLSIIAERSFP